MATVAQPMELLAVRRVGAGRATGGVGFYVLLSVLSVVSMFPFIWTFVSSGKTVAELYQIPPSLWPTSPQFVENYVAVKRHEQDRFYGANTVRDYDWYLRNA